MCKKRKISIIHVLLKEGPCSTAKGFIHGKLKIMFTRPICYHLNQNRLGEKLKEIQRKTLGSPSFTKKTNLSLLITPSYHFLFSLPFWNCQTTQRKPKFLPLCSLKIVAKEWRKPMSFLSLLSPNRGGPTFRKPKLSSSLINRFSFSRVVCMCCPHPSCFFRMAFIAEVEANELCGTNSSMAIQWSVMASWQQGCCSWRWGDVGDIRIAW